VESANEPASILNLTRSSIIERLKKDGSPEGGKDGMDCALLCYNSQTRTLKFSLANMPLWLIRNGVLQTFDPDKMPVGKHDLQQTPFKQQEIVLQAGDMIYAFTDGYADQFGGPKGKKFKHSNLGPFLLKISGLGMQKQKEELAKMLSDWRGDLEQIDDVCVFGMRIS
jgi:serine phosphatase RsbU (regulator of sigma subunit)